MNDLTAWHQQFTAFIIKNFTNSPLILLAILIFVLSAILCARGFLGMFAKLDEFESLTPLIITPGSTPSASKLASPSSTIFDAQSTSKSKTITPVYHEPFSNRLATRHSHPIVRSHFDSRMNIFSPIPQKQTVLSNDPILTSSDSPPPPRKNLTGKTLIVPLGPNNNRLSLTRTPLNLTPFAPLLGTPDSRVTSFEAGTTKSCATIPEDDELALDSDNNDEPEQTANSMDLISIDRTYGSMPKRVNVASTSAYDIQVPINVPEFKLPTPCYTPPAPPALINSKNGISPNSLRTIGHSRMNDSPNLSSPEGSSCGLASPIDTTGSISDSFLVPSDGDIDSSVRVYYIDAEQSNRGAIVSGIDFNDPDDHRQLPPLQRIDEESEHFEGSIVNSTTASYYDQGMNIIPRSISQQLVLMHNDKERRLKSRPENET